MYASKLKMKSKLKLVSIFVLSYFFSIYFARSYSQVKLENFLMLVEISCCCCFWVFKFSQHFCQFEPFQLYTFLSNERKVTFIHSPNSMPNSFISLAMHLFIRFYKRCATACHYWYNATSHMLFYRPLPFPPFLCLFFVLAFHRFYSNIPCNVHLTLLLSLKIENNIKLKMDAIASGVSGIGNSAF